MSPHLFNVYIDGLSTRLNKIPVGCSIGGQNTNHLLYADDLCLISPSIPGIPGKFADNHFIIFNATKTKAMYFNPLRICKLGDLYLSVHRCHGQISTGTFACVVAGFDGRPDAYFGADSRGYDGDGRRIYGCAHVAAV